MRTFTLSLSLAAAMALTLSMAQGARAASFHFTTTADSRALRTEFRHTLAQIKAQVGGAGVFHISPGDIDPPADNYADLVSAFGSGVIWFAGVGNHEAETASDMQWLRAHYALLPSYVQGGPLGTETTSYSFDYGNAHFVMINEYYDGASDTGTDGDVGDALYTWLAADLAASDKPVKLVFGHEPAFPKGNHVGDSLDQRPSTRDRFWTLLTQQGVQAYICGHTHSYSTYHESGTSLWQIDVGNAGNGSPLTFLDTTITDASLRFDVWQGLNGQAFKLINSWSVELDPGVISTPPVPVDPGPEPVVDDPVPPLVLEPPPASDPTANTGTTPAPPASAQPAASPTVPNEAPPTDEQAPANTGHPGGSAALDSGMPGASDTVASCNSLAPAGLGFAVWLPLLTILRRRRRRQ